MALRLHLQLTCDTNKEMTLFVLTIQSADRSWISAQDLKFLEKIPERLELDGMYSYEIGATDTTVKVLSGMQTSGHVIEFGDDDTETKFRYLQLRMEMTKVVQYNYAQFKESKVVPAHSLELHSDPSLCLSAYQQVGLVNAHVSEGYGLLMEQGTGKTAVAIADMCNAAIHAQEIPIRVLVICPNNVRLNWKSEIERFATQSHKITIVKGGQVKRINQLVTGISNTGEKINVIIMSYDTMVQTWEAMQLILWSIVYLDEAHYIKNARTRRWKFCKKLRDISERRRVLTGTPISNSIMDLYTLFEFMGEGFSGFNSFEAYKKYYGVFKESRENGYEALVAVQNIPVMKDRLSRYTFSITKREALPYLPEKVYDIIDVDMTAEQSDAYDRLATQLAYEIEAEMEGSDNIALTINNVLTKLLKLSQVTSGFLKIPDEKDEDGNVLKKGSVIYFDPNPKVQAIVDIASEKQPNQKTIVWACYIHDIEKIAEALRAAGHECVTYFGGTSDQDRAEAERKFNFDPNCRWFVGNPGAGGTGLNLLGYPPGSPDEADTNCDHVIYYSQDPSPVKRSQSEDRAHRRGTRTNVRVSDLCVANTIDETIRVRVLDKRKAALELSDVREILSAVLKR